MKYLFSFLTIASALALSIPHVAAQDKQGAVAFVNAVALENPTEILVNGTSIKPSGFERGRMTSFIAIPATSTEVKAKNGNVPSKALVTTPSPTGSSIFVVYLQETINTEGEKRQELRALAVPSLTHKSGFSQRVLLVGQESPASFLVNGQSLNLTPGVASKGIESGEVKIETPSGQLVGVSSSNEAGNFLVVIFPDLNGGYSFTAIRDHLIVFDSGT